MNSNRKKLKTIDAIRASIMEAGPMEKKFICNEYMRHIHKWSDSEVYSRMREELPELVEEITRTGRENNPDYEFPKALVYMKDGKIMHNSAYDTEKDTRDYNARKLELLDRVSAMLPVKERPSLRELFRKWFGRVHWIDLTLFTKKVEGENSVVEDENVPQQYVEGDDITVICTQENRERLEEMLSRK